MALADFISKIVTSITRATFQFNKSLDVLIDKFKEGCPTTQELKILIVQKNEINGALEQIEQKIATLNKVAEGSEIAAEALNTGKTVIKQLPAPSAVPPGVGLPLNIFNNFSDALDNLGTLIDKEKASLDTIPGALDIIEKDVGTVITKLKKFDEVLNKCLEEDPNITQEDLDSIDATTENFVGVLTNAELEKLLSGPPGLLYGDYYLRKQIVPTEFSFNKKQITAQNKESVPPPGEYYKEEVAVEMLYGDESFSSSNLVLVNEMKWLIDTKDLIFLPPPPAEDPLKAIYKAGQIVILMSIYGANEEEANELYELAWELSQNKGPNKGYYNTLVNEAFDNSRTVLEQAVANEGYEWKEGDRVLDSTIKKLFLEDYAKTISELELNGAISQIRAQARSLENTANSIGGGYNANSKRWQNDGDFTNNPNNKLYPYSERLASTAENLLNDNNIGNEFISLRPEMARRKSFMQAIFEAANYLFLSGRPYNFNDPLKEYFNSRGIGYNQPIINDININGTPTELISVIELEAIYEAELNIINNFNLRPDNLLPPNFDTAEDGLTFEQRKAYAKTKVFLKLLDTLGITWYNENAQISSELPFWSPGGGNPNSSSYNQNNPNAGLTIADKWYFEFGRNNLPIPTGL